MTTAHKQIIKRIQGHTSRIRSMLTPGLRKLSGEKNSGSLSTLFTGFGGGKLKHAAKKMRVLNVDRLGHFQLQARLKFAESIPKKFQEAQALIHFSPKFTRENSIWSDIERTLPAQASGHVDLPPQPGELRRGSIIQKFPMIPQPGQTAKEFEQYARSIPKPPKKPVLPPKPRPDPKSQMFSRIQEITDGDKVSVKKTERVDVKRTETPSKPKAKTLAKPKAETPAKLKAETPAKLKAETPASPDVVQPQVEKPLIPEVLEPEASSAEVVEDTALPSEPIPQLKRAEPAKEKSLVKQSLRQLPKAKPSKKERQTALPLPSVVQAKSIPLTREIVQRKRAVPTINKIPKPESPPVQAPHPVSEPEPKEAPRSIPLKPESHTPITLPLRKKIQSHKQIIDMFKSLRPESILPPSSPPILDSHSPPMIAKQKYHPQPKSMDSAVEPIQKPLAALDDGFPQPDLKSIWRSDPDGPPSGQQLESETDLALPSPWIDPLPMSLAYAKSPKTVPQVPLQPAVPPKEPSQQTPKPLVDAEKPVQQSPILESGETLVQRLTEDDDQSAGSEQFVQQLAETEESESEDLDSTVNLDQLAEDVLPMVKRILEIESERLSRNLH